MRHLKPKLNGLAIYVIVISDALDPVYSHQMLSTILKSVKDTIPSYRFIDCALFSFSSRWS